MTLMVGMAKTHSHSEVPAIMVSEANGRAPSGHTPDRALASALWDQLQAALVAAIREDVLPSSVLKGGPSKLATHLGSLLAERKEDVINAVLTAQAAPAAGTVPPALDLGRHDAEPKRGPLGVRFTHTCRALGCNDRECGLCRNNPHKRCTGPDFFGAKYLIGDTLAARCGAPLAVELYDIGTGAALDRFPADKCTVELFIVSGLSAPDCGEAPPAGGGRGASRSAAAAAAPSVAWQRLLTNQDGKPLLSLAAPSSGEAAAADGGAPAAAARHDARGAVVMPLLRSAVHSNSGSNSGTYAVLPPLQVTDSSEALLSGRKATFRLVATASLSTATNTTNTVVAAAAGVSPPFVVATRRIKSNLKEEIPLVSDPVAKLDQVGKQTADKLADLETAAAAAKPPVALHLPWELRALLAASSTSSPSPSSGGGYGGGGEMSGGVSVTTVGQLRSLMEAAEKDAGPSGLKKALCKVLKMTAEHWKRTLQRVEGAVDKDERLRRWYPDTSAAADATAAAVAAGVPSLGGGRLGVLFGAKQGCVELDRPLGLLSQSSDGSEEAVTLVADLSSSQRSALARLLPQAAAAWAAPQHPGWEACDVDAATFEATGMLLPAGGAGRGGGGGGGLTGGGGRTSARLAGLPLGRAASGRGPSPPASPGLSPHRSLPPEAAAVGDEPPALLMSANPGAAQAAAAELLLPAAPTMGSANGGVGQVAGGMGISREGSFADAAALGSWLLNGSIAAGGAGRADSLTGALLAAAATNATGGGLGNGLGNGFGNNASGAGAVAAAGQGGNGNGNGSASQDLSFLNGLLANSCDYSFPAGLSLGLGSMGLGLGPQPAPTTSAPPAPADAADATAAGVGGDRAAAVANHSSLGLDAALLDPLSSFAMAPLSTERGPAAAAAATAAPLAAAPGLLLGAAGGFGGGGSGGAVSGAACGGGPESMLEQVTRMAGQHKRSLEACGDTPMVSADCSAGTAVASEEEEEQAAEEGGGGHHYLQAPAKRARR